jgi:hypothetical protein
VTVRVVRSAVFSVQWLGMMICYGMAVKSLGMLGVSVRKGKGLAVEMETVTLTGRGR